MQVGKCFLAVILIGLFAMTGCGSGNNNSTAPAASSIVPVFVSLPVTSASQGTQYIYQVKVSGASVSLQLTTAPSGTVLNGNTITWTPTPEQSRIANNFTVTANAPGGAAAQSWVVTPTGTVTINWVDTSWSSSGSSSTPALIPANSIFPAALVPQPDGSVLTRQGTTISPGVFAIPGVPAGHYWLEIGPAAIFWTSTSNFDFSGDAIGAPLQAAPASSTTTFDLSLSGLDPSQAAGWLGFMTDARDFDLSSPGFNPATTSLNISTSFNSNIDLSGIRSIYLSQYEPAIPASLNALVMGPELTVSNVAISNGAANNLPGALNPSPTVSTDINIKGSAWAEAATNIAPSQTTPIGSILSLAVQPFVNDRIADPNFTNLGPNLPLVTPSRGLSGFCSPSTSASFSKVNGVFISPPEFTIQPAILTDQDFGPVQYGDPFPVNWLRVFSFCQGFTAQVPLPNSSTTQPFTLQNGESSLIPSAPVAPLLTAVQNPTLNGSSLFTPATLNTDVITLGWAPPATGQSFGYYIQVFAFSANSFAGAPAYLPTLKFGTSTNSISLLPLDPGSYVFMITAIADAKANMETSPRHSALPTAYADVLSAPITISSSAVPAAIGNPIVPIVQSTKSGLRFGPSSMCAFLPSNPQCFVPTVVRK